jgi:hypothetical protein
VARIDSYHRILQASAEFQRNIALVLEAKAVEAARSSQWLCHQLSGSHFDDHSEQVKKTIEIHEHLLEVIYGMTKMEHALAKNMQTILGDHGPGGPIPYERDGPG